MADQADSGKSPDRANVFGDGGNGRANEVGKLLGAAPSIPGRARNSNEVLNRAYWKKVQMWPQIFV